MAKKRGKLPEGMPYRVRTEKIPDAHWCEHEWVARKEPDPESKVKWVTNPFNLSQAWDVSMLIVRECSKCGKKTVRKMYPHRQFIKDLNL